MLDSGRTASVFGSFFWQGADHQGAFWLQTSRSQVMCTGMFPWQSSQDASFRGIETRPSTATFLFFYGNARHSHWPEGVWFEYDSISAFCRWCCHVVFIKPRGKMEWKSWGLIGSVSAVLICLLVKEELSRKEKVIYRFNCVSAFTNAHEFCVMTWKNTIADTSSQMQRVRDSAVTREELGSDSWNLYLDVFQACSTRRMLEGLPPSAGPGKVLEFRYLSKRDVLASLLRFLNLLILPVTDGWMVGWIGWLTDP